MPMMTRLGLALVLLVAALVSALAPAKADERILRFVSDVAAQTNGDLIVIETIRVRAEGNVIKRGILRDFPTTYTNRDGTRIEVGFSVQSVTRDGIVENFATERLSNGYRVRIGRSDTMLSTGEHQYVIRYRTTRQIGFFKDFDEIYWNATGNGWTFPIDVAEARITLPAAVPIRQSAFYTGAQGSRDKDATIVEQAPGRIVFRTTKSLPPAHGLTVAAGFDKGVVTPPTATERRAMWVRDNLPIALTFAALALVIGYYVYAWRAVGRDPRPGTMVPLFAPPNGLSAAAVRYVWRMGMDDKTFTAALIDLAVRGHAKLVEKKTEGMRIEPRKGGTPLGVADRELPKKLFGAHPASVDIDSKNHSTFERAKAALEDGLKGAYADKLFRENKAWSMRGILVALGLCLLVLVSVFAAWGADDGITTLIGMLASLPLLLILSVLAVKGLPRSGTGFGLLAIGCIFAIWIGSGAFTLLGQVWQGWLHAAPIALPVILVPLASSAFSWMKAHTSEGRRVTDQIEGFRHYLGVAERDRLNALSPPEDTVELFEKYLPYAIALDVENEWGKRFAAVLAAASAGAAVAASGEYAWYHGRSDGTDWSRDPAGFASYLGSGLSETIVAASIPPASTTSGSGGFSSDSSSSGSSGGGSSGGGGGGGSGW